MAKKVYNVVAITGKYTDRDGNEKNRYVTIGAVIQTDKGMSLRMEAIPTGWDGWAGLYEPEEKQQEHRPASRPQGRSAGNSSHDDDSIPF
jgi:hypothetical protein